MLVGSFTNAPAAASCLNPRPGIAACSAHTATCHVLRCRKRMQAISPPTAVGDRYMSKSAAPPATDWAGSVRTYARVWGFPIAIMVAGLLVDVPARTAMWTLALAWKGTACLLNAHRCGR